MPESIRGGNHRLLGRNFDGLKMPLAILDRKSQIVFVNAAFCEIVGSQAADLVGMQCRWDLPEDSHPQRDLARTLAPPESVRHGKQAKRINEADGFSAAGFPVQSFIPILDEDCVLFSTLIVFAEPESNDGKDEFATENPLLLDRASRIGEIENTLVGIRQRWKSLDDLHALVGESAAIRLAMSRTQLAVREECNLVLHGPKGVGKTEISRGIFDARLKHSKLNPLAGQYFPLDCAVLDTALLEGLLEVFSGRLKSDLAARSQLLVLANFEQLADAAVPSVNRWLGKYGTQCTITAICNGDPATLSRRNSDWASLVSRLAVVEVEVPGLNQRPEDIPLLAHQALAAACREQDRAVLNIAPDTLDLLTAFPWPNNLEQLKLTIDSAVKHAVLTTTIQPSHLPVELRTFASDIKTDEDQLVEPVELDVLLEDIERIVIQRAMKLSPRNRAQVARLLGISRTRLLRRLDQLGLTEESSQQPGE